jgi:gluconolactonase
MCPAPPVIETKVFVDVNAAHGIHDRPSQWAGLLFGHPNTPSFLEGPSLDRDGNLWLMDVA